MMDVERAIAGPEALVADGAITIEEAVRWSGIGRTRIYSLMAEGRLRYAQVGRRRLIPRAALRQILAEAIEEGGAAGEEGAT